MDIKNIDRYKTFGFRQEWLELYLEDPAAFWENDRLGVDMFYAFDKWAREILLIDEKSRRISSTTFFVISFFFQFWGAPTKFYIVSSILQTHTGTN